MMRLILSMCQYATVHSENCEILKILPLKIGGLTQTPTKTRQGTTDRELFPTPMIVHITGLPQTVIISISE